MPQHYYSYWPLGQQQRPWPAHPVESPSVRSQAAHSDTLNQYRCRLHCWRQRYYCLPLLLAFALLHQRNLRQQLVVLLPYELPQQPYARPADHVVDQESTSGCPPAILIRSMGQDHLQVEDCLGSQRSRAPAQLQPSILLQRSRQQQLRWQQLPLPLRLA